MYLVTEANSTQNILCVSKSIFRQWTVSNRTCT